VDDFVPVSHTAPPKHWGDGDEYTDKPDHYTVAKAMFAAEDATKYARKAYLKHSANCYH
jgi:hypothetical protein